MFLRFGRVAHVRIWTKFNLDVLVSLGVRFQAAEGARAALNVVEAIELSDEALGVKLCVPTLGTVGFESESRLRVIGKNCFERCAAESIMIPRSVAAVGCWCEDLSSSGWTKL
jgi:hypothetical protein